MAQERPAPFARAGAIAWRLLGIGALVVASWLLARQLMPVLVPLVVAVLLAALMEPLAERLKRRRFPAALAAGVTVLALIAAIVVIGLLVVPPIADRASELGSNVEAGAREVAYSLGSDVANLDRADVDRAIDDAISSLGSSQGDIAGGILAGATALATGLAALVLILFLSFFLVKDRHTIGGWMASLMPADRRDELAELGHDIWSTLTTYSRGLVFVATFDAIAIALLLLVTGVPLVLPLAALTWLAAFFPIIGAVSAGLAAILVALVDQGVATAVIIFVGVLAIQQIEGNVLYPAIVGPRVHLHPIAVLLAVTVGATIGGIPGAFLAVPVAVVISVVIEHRRRHSERELESSLTASVADAERALAVRHG